ncbi:MAG TPA: hypothetical protein VFE47_15180 [Tepidisphaeraceae bacterium]|nr:hypothetical protein [Tepidisphaeraceae bacterium]
MRISPFEKDLIAAALAHPGDQVSPGTILALMPSSDEFRLIYETAVSPALYGCGFATRVSEPAFDSNSWLSDIARQVLGAELIVADLTGFNADVLYVLGLCHGHSRCPLLITQDVEELPFNLETFRLIRYMTEDDGLFKLREDLARAVRVFLAEAAASREGGNDKKNRG